MRRTRLFGCITTSVVALWLGASRGDAADKRQWQNGKVTDIVPLVFAWTYEIEGENHIYVATKYQKPCRLTVDAPLRFTVDGDVLRLTDEVGRKHKLKIDFKKAKAAPTDASEPAPAIPTGGAIKSGMSAAEIEHILGKPKESADDGSRTRWTYDDVIVVLDGGKVVELKFVK